jgi:hypothetical protein
VSAPTPSTIQTTKETTMKGNGNRTTGAERAKAEARLAAIAEERAVIEADRERHDARSRAIGAVAPLGDTGRRWLPDTYIAKQDAKLARAACDDKLADLLREEAETKLALAPKPERRDEALAALDAEEARLRADLRQATIAASEERYARLREQEHIAGLEQALRQADALKAQAAKDAAEAREGLALGERQQQQNAGRMAPAGA